MRNAKESFRESIKTIYKFIDDTLQSKGKSYKITYRNKEYIFDPPFTLEEKKKMDKMREKIAKIMLRDVFNMFLKQLPISYNIDEDWWSADAFRIISQLEALKPIEYYAIDKIHREVYTPDLDKDGKQITSKPLNQDSIYVQWQDISKYPIEGEEQC
jgi:hypothetical protein